MRSGHWARFSAAQTGLVCILIAASCSVGVRHEGTLPEIAYAGELQAAVMGVLENNPAERRLGISAAVIAPGWQPWQGVGGYSHADEPITVETLFDAGSIAKNFEAALVLELAEDGALALEDPVSKYLPELKNVDGAITIRQLLNHTSGVYNVFEHPDFPWVGSGVDYSRSWELAEVFENFVGEPYGRPGEVQHYSSTNYLLLTAIIAQTAGASAADEVKERFLIPLGLEHTYMSMGDPPSGNYPVAHPWVDIDRDGVLEDLYGIPLTWKVSLTHPVLYATPGDLARWMQALYHEQTVLDAEYLEMMLSTPEVSQLDPEGGIYGLGVVDYTDRLGAQAIGHAGSALGYSAAALYLPEYGVSLAWMINTGESPPEPAGRMMFEAWEGLYEVVDRNEALKE